MPLSACAALGLAVAILAGCWLARAWDRWHVGQVHAQARRLDDLAVHQLQDRGRWEALDALHANKVARGG